MINLFTSDTFGVRTIRTAGTRGPVSFYKLE